MVKISELSSLTVPANDDELAIVDNAGVITKKIRRDDVLKGAPLPANTVDTQSIADANVTTAKLANASITYEKTDGKIWWEEIGRATLVADGDTITVSGLPNRKYLKVIASVYATGGTIRLNVFFNNDTAGNYARRRSENGAADSIGASSGEFFTAVAASGDILIDFEVLNVASREKVGCGMQAQANTAGAGNVPNRIEFSGKWANTSNVISRIDITNGGTGDFAIASEIVVLGHN